MAEVQYLTSEGKDELERELEMLKTVRRPELARKIADAVSMGDLKENADYHDAKEQQGFIEGRIRYIESILRTAVVAEGNAPAGVVGIGSTVIIVEDGTSEEEAYTIVGTAEANPKERKISYQSPIGAALMGHKKGDKVRAQAPGGEIVFRIRRVQ